jgi:phage gpG-like protein
MAVEVYFEVDGEVQLARALSRFGENVKDLRPAFNQISSLFYNIEKKQFTSEGSYGSGGWKALSPKYAEWKARNYPGKPILQRSGRMMSSLTGQTGDTVREMGPLWLRLGTSVYYAFFHQRGTKYMPKRKPIELTEIDKRNWVKAVQRFLVNMAREKGLL